MLVVRTYLFACLLFVVSCQNPAPTHNTPPILANGPVTAPSPSAQDNPLGTEGQRVRFEVQIAVTEVKGLEKAPQDAQGLLKADGATFKIARENGPDLASGTVSNNSIAVPAEQLGEGPYTLSITLPTGEILNSRFQDTLNNGDVRIIRANQITVAQKQECEEAQCNTAGGDVKVEATNINNSGSGNVCVAINCKISDKEKQ